MMHAHQHFLQQLYTTDLFSRSVSKQVCAALEEDLGSGDIHGGLYSADQRVQARIISRENAILCGKPWVEEVFRQLGDHVKLNWLIAEGERVTADQTIVELTGPAAPLLAGERCALNFMQLLMGCATTTAQFLSHLEGSQTKLLDTRKTIPGLRLAQKYAVCIGGGNNHRIGLWDAFLLKENHIAATGSLIAAIDKARKLSPSQFLEIEVETLEQLEQAIVAGVDRILLDNFPIEMLQQAVQLREQHQSQVQLEASGNVTELTLGQIAATGVDYVSTGAMTKHVQAIDLSLRIY